MVAATVRFSWCLTIGFLGALAAQVSARAAEPSYVRDVQPLLRKYCGGCHNEADKEGDFSTATYASLLKGVPDGTVIQPGDVAASRLLKLLDGTSEPKMPPEDEAQPTADEIGKLKQWIASGAKNDADKIPLAEQITAPTLRPDSESSSYITALVDVGPHIVAIGRLGKCEIRDASTQQVLFQIGEPAGKINQMRTSRDGRYLLLAGGIAGVGGQVVIVDLQARKVIGRLQGHTDSIYAAAMSPDGHYVLTGSYDRSAILWDWRKQEIVRRFLGHNGAVYDVDIDPEGKMVATASADQTVKLWGLSDGTRLDTLGQGEGEMLCVRFTPDGRHVLASGADRQLRSWQILSKDRPMINPLRISRFAHEEPVTQIVFRGDDQLLSLSEDRTVKLWQMPDLNPLGVVMTCRDVPVGVGKLSELATQVVVADYRGSISVVTLPEKRRTDSVPATTADGLAAFKPAAPATQPPGEPTVEKEPNNRLPDACAITLPARIDGVIASENDGQSDMDLFAFDALAGQPWVLEIKAARDKSPLDSLLDILDKDGQPVLRTRLQAVRESYFTFRGKDSNTSDDFRMHKWQEMELNELLYAGGEVVQLWLYPRGPDSGFKVYPGYGNRTTLFDTTPTAHALGEMAYIVRPLQEGMEPLPNGLPVFPIYYQNDDDSQRRLGKDSRLTFRAPADGRYIVRVRDARGFGGEDFKYQLTIRPEQPDFELEFKGTEMTLPAGSGREWQVTARRLDGLQSPIEIHLESVPEGLQVTNPLVIEAGQDIAYGNVYAAAGTSLPDGQDKFVMSMRAISRHPGGEVVHELEKRLTVAIKDGDEVRLKLVDAADNARELEELVIRPGQTVSAKVIVERGQQKGPIALGKEDAGRNLPHGSYVDNIGLNGLLITDEASEREFFITAAKWLEPQERLFHLRSETKNNPTSRSIRLRIVPQ